MNNFLKFLFFFLILIPFQANSQQIVKFTGISNSFLYDGQVYKYKQLEAVMSLHPTALECFEKANTNSKLSMNFGLLALGSLGTGLIALASYPPEMYCDLVCISEGQVIGVLTIGILAPIFGGISLAHSYKSTKFKEESFRIINHKLSKDSSWNLKLGSTPHGLGLVLNF